MKKVVNIMSIILILVLFNLTINKDILSLTISFSIYILLNSIFSTTNIKSNNYKILKLSIISILIIGIILMIISYETGVILNIEKLNIINIFMVLSLIFNTIFKLTNKYLDCVGYKKLSVKLINVYNIVTLTIKIILTILLFGLLKTPVYVNVISLYLVDVIISLLLGVIIYSVILKKNKLTNKDNKNYITEVKKVLVENKTITIYNLINSSYIYISIIILYFTLSNRYNYNYHSVSMLITNTYFYGLIIVYYIHKIIKIYLNINFKDKFLDNFNKIIKILSTLIIFLTIISKPLSYVLFKSEFNLLVNLIPLLFIYILYDFIINTNMIYNKEKNIIISLVVGIIVKTVFEIPLINTIYRMGYMLSLGSVLSTALGMIISSIIGIILIKNKQKINLLENFNNLLNIIYETLIYTFVMVLFTLIVKINTSTMILSILTIIFYTFTTIIFLIIKRKIIKK